MPNTSTLASSPSNMPVIDLDVETAEDVQTYIVRELMAHGSATFYLRADQKASWFQRVRSGAFQPGFPIKLQTHQNHEGLRFGHIFDTRKPGVDLPPEVEKERDDRICAEASAATSHLPGLADLLS